MLYTCPYPVQNVDDARFAFLQTCLHLCFSVVCPSGKYFNANNEGACENCPVDMYSTGTNSDSCLSCPPGTNTGNNAGQTSESACGKYLSFC